MSASPVPSPDEVRDNATYDALMWSLARPGTIRRLPQPGLAAILLTLVDRECRVWSDDAVLVRLAVEAGARRARPEEADHGFMADPSAALDALAVLPTGSALYPDEGATVVVVASIGEGRLLRLAGPGIEDRAEIRLGALPDRFLALRAERCRYPAGLDLFFVDGDRVVGLPRSTSVEVC